MYGCSAALARWTGERDYLRAERRSCGPCWPRAAGGQRREAGERGEASERARGIDVDHMSFNRDRAALE